MGKKVLWIVPTGILALCIMYNRFSNILDINIEVSEIIAIIAVGIIGIVFIAPCLYVYLININRDRKQEYIKSILLSIAYININAIIASPNSILWYMGVKERGVHDLDLLPMYIIVPLVIIFAGVLIMQTLEFIKKKRSGG